MIWATLKAKTVSAPQVGANLANINGIALENTTANAFGNANSDANGNTNDTPLPKAVSIIHQRKSMFSRVAAKLEGKEEKKLALPLRHDVPCQPEAGYAADLQVESNAYKQPHRTRTASVTREQFREPMTRYLTQDKEERPKHPDQGISNARVRQTRASSVAHEPLHRPTSHPPRASAAHHSLHQPTSDPSVHDLEDRSERDIQPVINAERSQETEGRVQPSLYQPPHVENRLRKSVRSSNIAYRNNKLSYREKIS